MTNGFRPDIDLAIQRMGYKVGSGREINKLMEHLWEGETVQYLLGGTYGNGTGLLAATNLRLIFLKDGLFSKTHEDFPLKSISSVQWSSGMILGSITIFLSGNKAEIKNIQKGPGKELSDWVRAVISGAVDPNPQQIVEEEESDEVFESLPETPVTPIEKTSAGEVATSIRHLAELRDQGLLTEDEFTAKKSELLGRL